MRYSLHAIVLTAACLCFPGLARGSNPTGTLDAINASTGIATGHASDADRAGQSILVDFWIGPGLTTYIGETATQAGSNAFTFQVPMQYRDGLPRQICAWAINQAAPHTMIGCIIFTQASTLPTGTLASISANGVASGTATDADRPGQSILVDFWIGTGYTNYVGETATQASTGAYGFQIPAQYRDGISRSFCAWAINDVEPHVMIGCKSYQFVDHPPTGVLSSVDSNAVARGSANDPDLPGQEIDVKFYRGANPSTAVYLGHKVTVGGNFAYTISATNRVSGKICAYATQGGADFPIGCAQYVKPGLAYYGYYTSSTPFRDGMGDHTDEVTDHTNLAWVESNDCNVISSTDEDWEYCGIPSSPTLNRQTYVETLPGSGRQIDFFDLISRVAKAGSVNDKVMLHLQQFLFAFSTPGKCFYLRDDADAILQAVSRQLNYHGLMSTVVAIYPIDEPYVRSSVPESSICHSATDQTPFATAAEQHAAIYQAMTSVLASIRAVDSQSGAARFPGKKTALILAYTELGWTDAPIPADYDWIGYDGYIATGESTQDYGNFLAQLKAKIAVLPNASSKKIMLIPEAYAPDSSVPEYSTINEARYSVPAIAAQCTSEVAPPSNFIPSNDGHRRPECVLLSNFLKAYRIALCDPTIIAIVPFLWQGGLDAEFPVGSPDRYRDLTNYLVTATLVGGGITQTPYALPTTSCPAQ